MLFFFALRFDLPRIHPRVIEHLESRLPKITTVDRPYSTLAFTGTCYIRGGIVDQHQFPVL